MSYCPYPSRPLPRGVEQDWHALMRHALIAHRDGYYRDALELYEMALALTRKRGGPADLRASVTLRSLGALTDECGRYGHAEEKLQAALFGFERCAPGKERNNYMARTLGDLGQLYLHLGALRRAEAMLNRALLTLGGLDAADGRYIETVSHLGQLRRAEGRWEDAEKLYIRMWELTLREYGPDHRHMGAYELGMSALYAAQQRYDEAECAAMKALCVYRKTMRPEHPRLALAYFAWASAAQGQCRDSAAEPLLRQGLRIRENGLGAESPALLCPLAELAALLRRQGRDAEAAALEARHARIGNSTGGKGPCSMRTSR